MINSSTIISFWVSVPLFPWVWRTSSEVYRYSFLYIQNLTFLSSNITNHLRAYLASRFMLPPTRGVTISFISRPSLLTSVNAFIFPDVITYTCIMKVVVAPSEEYDWQGVAERRFHKKLPGDTQNRFVAVSIAISERPASNKR